MTKTYSLFISHSWDHDDVLQSLMNLINSRGYFPALYTQVERTYPIHSEFAWVVKANITKRLEQSEVELAIAGLYASHSDWMQWEMDKAREVGLNVIGVIPRGQKQYPESL